MGETLRLVLYSAVLFILTAGGESDEINVNLKNYHKVSDDLYRSAQPNRKEMHLLELKGFKTVINLRNVLDDHSEIKKTGMSEIHLPMRAKKVGYDDILNTMRVIRDAQKPVLIHCRRGSDRTGCMVAFYRMVFQSWSKEEALEEFRNEEYGYYEQLFPNLIELVEAIDPEQLKKDLSKR